MEATKTNKSVAVEILKQLGGNRFIAMTGAKHLACDNNSMSCKIMRNSMKVTHIKITLNSKYTYDMKFYSIRGASFKVKSEANGVYNDMLQATFTRHTGLNTSL